MEIRSRVWRAAGGTLEFMKHFVSLCAALALVIVASVEAGAQSATSRLTVSQSGGSAAYITSSPAGIDALCASSACTKDFPKGSEVSLHVEAAANSFTWGGACSGTAGATCRLRMDGDKSVSVERRAYKITYTFNSKYAGILIANPGNKTLSANGHVQTFTQGTEVTLTQWQMKGGGGPDVSKMVSWGGACSGQPVGTCRLVMDGDKAVTAEWADAQATTGALTLKILMHGVPKGYASETPGVFQVTPPGKVISDCRPFTGGCIERFNAGTTVTIQALGSATTQIDHWVSGCDASTRNTCTVKMDKDRTVQVTFNYSAPR
jgi:hypothetical protein